MKILLDIDNVRKGIKPSKDNIIIYDGKSWYITTKEDIFEEYQAKVDAKIAEAEEKLAAIEEFKREISSQMVELSEMVKKFIKLQGEK